MDCLLNPELPESTKYKFLEESMSRLFHIFDYQSVINRLFGDLIVSSATNKWIINYDESMTRLIAGKVMSFLAVKRRDSVLINLIKQDMSSILTRQMNLNDLALENQYGDYLQGLGVHRLFVVNIDVKPSSFEKFGRTVTGWQTWKFLNRNILFTGIL